MSTVLKALKDTVCLDVKTNVLVAAQNTRKKYYRKSESLISVFVILILLIWSYKCLSSIGYHRIHVQSAAFLFVFFLFLLGQFLGGNFDGNEAEVIGKSTFITAYFRQKPGLFSQMPPKSLLYFWRWCSDELFLDVFVGTSWLLILKLLFLTLCRSCCRPRWMGIFQVLWGLPGSWIH